MNNSECYSSFFFKKWFIWIGFQIELNLNLGAFSSIDAEWDLWLWLNIVWLLLKTVPGYLDGISSIPYKVDLH